MSGHPHSYYVRTASAFRKGRYLLVKAILPQAILKYLQVYYAILMANNRFCIDSQCLSLLSLGGDAALDAVLEWIRPEVSRLVAFRRQSRRSLFLRSGFQTAKPQSIFRQLPLFAILFCVSAPQEKGAWLEAMPTSREVNWFFRMWM